MGYESMIVMDREATEAHQGCFMGAGRVQKVLQPLPACWVERNPCKLRGGGKNHGADGSKFCMANVVVVEANGEEGTRRRGRGEKVWEERRSSRKRARSGVEVRAPGGSWFKRGCHPPTGRHSPTTFSGTNDSTPVPIF